MNTAPADRDVTRRASLYDAVAALERHYGAGFVHAPARWGTADGMIEYRHAHLYADRMKRQQAAERLHLARARVIGHGGETAARLAEQDERAAHGD